MVYSGAAVLIAGSGSWAQAQDAVTAIINARIMTVSSARSVPTAVTSTFKVARVTGAALTGIGGTLTCHSFMPGVTGMRLSTQCLTTEALKPGVRENEIVVLLGANGNGKSTFAKLIAGRMTTMAGRRYASDKPDLRFGMAIEDLSDAFRQAPFGPFRDALGAGGVATLWEAVFADVGVALLAILNAVRIQKMEV